MEAVEPMAINQFVDVATHLVVIGKPLYFPAHNELGNKGFFLSIVANLPSPFAGIHGRGNDKSIGVWIIVGTDFDAPG